MFCIRSFFDDTSISNNFPDTAVNNYAILYIKGTAIPMSFKMKLYVVRRQNSRVA